MDRVIVLTTKAEALAVVDAIDALAAAWWRAEGYSVEVVAGGYQLIGRRQSTGALNRRAAPTHTWDTPREAPDGRWYVRSLTGTRWAAGMDGLRASIPTMVEMEMPDEWMDEG